MATRSSVSSASTRFARAILRADGMVCGVSGVLLLAGALPISRFLGLGSAVSLVAIGALFLPHGIGLFLAANKTPIERRSLLMHALENTAWVVGSVALLVSGRPTLTTGGKWAVALVADVVAIFATLQFFALRRGDASDARTANA